MMEGMDRLPSTLNWIRVGITLSIASLFLAGDMEFGFIFIGIGFFMLPRSMKDRNNYGLVASVAGILSINSMESVLFTIVRDNCFEFFVVVFVLEMMRHFAPSFHIEKSQRSVSEKVLYWFIASYILTAFTLNVENVISIPLTVLLVGCKVVGYVLLLNNVGLLYRIAREENAKTSSTVQ